MLDSQTMGRNAETNVDSMKVGSIIGVGQETMTQTGRPVLQV